MKKLPENCFWQSTWDLPRHPPTANIATVNAHKFFCFDSEMYSSYLTWWDSFMKARITLFIVNGGFKLNFETSYLVIILETYRARCVDDACIVSELKGWSNNSRRQTQDQRLWQHLIKGLITQIFTISTNKCPANSLPLLEASSPCSSSWSRRDT